MTTTAVAPTDDLAALGVFRITDDPTEGQPPELAWQDRALCSQTEPEAFFPDKGGSTRAAKRTCMSCVVRAECLNYALAKDERFGIWGGLSERERRRLKRRTT
jgi:WhiB family redox-sensing transcriptional regulator